MRGLAFFLLAAPVALAQTIQDVYYTAWNQSQLFAYQQPPRGGFASFGQPGPAAQATIVVNDTNLLQPIDGYGATLTDTSALTLLGLKSTNSVKYWALLTKLFDASDLFSNAGFHYLRVTLGASDLSPFPYTYDDTPGDDLLLRYTVQNAQNILQVIRDVRLVQPNVKYHILPWSPPAWMKTGTNATLYGGSFNGNFTNLYANYLLKAAQAFTLSVGAPPYAIGIQNEPQNSNPTYPTCLVTVDEEGQIGTKLRSLLNLSLLGSTKIIGYEHNWDDAADYPVQLMQNYGNAFAGVAFHCYAGGYKNQAAFTAAFPNKEVYFTECTGTIGSGFWSDIKWWYDNLFVGSVAYGARTAPMWNLAANAEGGPTIPGTTSCGGGCRPIVVIANGTYTFSQEYYALAQAQRATIPQDLLALGNEGRLVGSTTGGSIGWALRANVYMAPPLLPGGRNRYSLLVLNWYDNASPGPVNPISVQTTISFRGLQANYTFPVGVTTLSWYA